MTMKQIFLALILTAAVFPASGKTFWLGADVSAASELERRNWKLYNTAGEERNYFALMKEIGMNAIRLRVWVNPKQGLCSPADVADMAEQAKREGLEVMIDFHYSDWWADPGKQNIPEQWKYMTLEQMKDALSEHTRYTLNLIKAKGVDVRWIQIGNETTNGFLWPVAFVGDNIEEYAALTEAGYQAAKEVFPEAVCIVHLDCGSDINRYHKIFNGLKKFGAHWDMIGMSVYPYWDLDSKLTQSEDETLEKVIENINLLHEEYGTPLMIVETGYDVKCPNQGKLFMQRLIKQSRDNTGGACEGVFYWAPEAEEFYPLGAFHDHKPTVILDPFNANLMPE